MVRAAHHGAIAASPARYTADGLVFSVATTDDDRDIRELLHSNPIPGWVTLSYEREPDYFLGAGVEGDVHQSVLAREAATGRVVGLFSRSEQDAFINGVPARLGYLGQLRVAPAYRRRVRRLRQGFEACRRLLHDGGTVPFYLTSVVEANAPARRILTAGLPGLPTYRELCGFSTFVVRTSRRGHYRPKPNQPIIRHATPADFASLASLLRRNYRRYQCAPVWDETALRSPTRCRGLSAEDFLIAEVEGKPVGCAALWDQRAFKQHVVRAYDSRLPRWRGLLNVLTGVAGLPRLPAVGAVLSQMYLSHLAVDDDDPEVFVSLATVARHEAARRGAETLLVGMSENHPLRNRLRRRFRHLEYRSILYLVHWDDGQRAATALDGRPVHVELATL